jgi:hypothetical protein
MGMGGGSKQAQPAPVPTATSQTITTNNIPSYLAPYVQDVAGKAQSIADEKYIPYGGQRIAGFDPLQTQAQNQMAGLGAIDFGQAKNYAQQVGQYGLQAGQAGINRANAYLSTPTQQFNYGQQFDYGKQFDYGQQFDYGKQFDYGQFGAQQAAQYMNPYQQSVTDAALREAREASAQQANTAALRSAGSGSAGGSRQAIFQAMAARDEGRLRSDIQAKGSEAAYLNAQQQWGLDRASAQQGFEQRKTAGQRAFEQGKTAEQRAFEQERTSAQQGFSQRKTAEQRAFEENQSTRSQQAQLGSTYGMQGLSAAGQAARGLGELGALQQKTDMERIGAQDRVGGVRQAQQQQGMDQRYADFLRQRDYPKEQMSWYSNIIHGLPNEMNSSAITYNREPSTAQQISGLGIAGLGAYGAYRDTRSPTS